LAQVGVVEWLSQSRRSIARLRETELATLVSTQQYVGPGVDGIWTMLKRIETALAEAA
jgi:hypothetical protein